MTIYADNIPAELKALPQWVGWRYEQRGELRTKALINVRSGYHASTADPKTWATFDAVWNVWKDPTAVHIDGIGFVFTEDDPYCGIDVDKIFKADWGQRWVHDEFTKHFSGSYIEKSPSGTGLHAICKEAMKLPKGRKFDYKDPVSLEVYDKRRYFTITGDVVIPTPDLIPEKQAGIDWILSLHPKNQPTQQTPQAPTEPVDVVIRPGAKPPQDKFLALCQARPEFNATWMRARKLPRDSSSSGYDLALADYAAHAEWTAQEICDLLVAHREFHHEDILAHRVDKYSGVIQKAMADMRRDTALEKLPLATTLDDSESLNAVCHVTGLDVVKYMQHGISPSSFRVYLADGHRIPLGNAQDARSQEVWMTAVQEHKGAPFMRLSPQQWQHFLVCLGKIVVKEHQDIPTYVQEMAGWLTLYKLSARDGAEYLTVKHKQPFIEEQCLWINMHAFELWLRQAKKTKTSQNDLGNTLAAMKGERKRVLRRDTDHGDVITRYWKIPLDILEE